MAISDIDVELQFSSIVADTPITVGIQTSGVAAEIFVTYGSLKLLATQGLDYSVTFPLDGSLFNFTVTPTASLLSKIAINGPNVIYVSRILPYITDFDYDNAFIREKLVDEFDRTIMRFQQISATTSATIPEAPNDGQQYARQSLAWVVTAPLASPTFTGDPKAPTPATADNDTSIATTAFVKIQGYVTTAGAAAAAPVQSVAGKTGVVTLVKADVGLGNVDNTSDANKPVSTAQQTALNLKADLASPILTGNPTAPTASPGDNDTSIATTAFVTAAVGVVNIPPATVAPLMDGVAAVGTTTKYAREDHRHPSDTAKLDASSYTAADVLTKIKTVDGVGSGLDADLLDANNGAFYLDRANHTGTQAESTVTNLVTDLAAKAPLASPVFTGDPQAPTPLTADNDTSIATTAFVKAQSYVTAATAPVTSVATKTGAVTLVKGDVGLGSVDNTSDAAKPVSTATQTALNLKADLASPVLTGNPTAPTPTAGDNDTTIATTAFVQAAIAGGTAGVASWNARVGIVTLSNADVIAVLPSSATAPVIDGVAAAGSSTAWSRGDHVHPTDTSRLAVAAASATNPVIDGTATPGVAASYSRGDHVHPTDTSRLATSATSATNPVMDGSATPGVATTWARSDHVHPTDTSRAPLASPIFTGDPQAPTPATADNDTSVATTAFVKAQGYQTAAQVTAAVPVASTANPIINGTADDGVATTWSKGDHVHPTDTSRYAAANPSGYQTAAQVTAAVAGAVERVLGGGATRVFTATGTYTPTSGMLYCIVECVGGGGGAGGVGATSGAMGASGGAGGGGYSRKVCTAAEIGASIAVTVGTGGAGNGPGNLAGSAGNDSSVGALCIAKGGSGSSGVSTGGAGAGAAGGVAGTGDFTVAGQAGKNGSGAVVATIPIATGDGGNAALGFGHGGRSADISNGNPGQLYGGGGSGASDRANTSRSGGSGANGIVIITEFCN